MWPTQVGSGYLAIWQRGWRSRSAKGALPEHPASHRRHHVTVLPSSLVWHEERELRPREIEVSSIDCAREERRRQLDRCRTAMFGSRVATRVLLAGARPVLGVHDCLYPWLVVWRNDQVDIW